MLGTIFIIIVTLNDSFFEKIYNYIIINFSSYTFYHIILCTALIIEILLGCLYYAVSHHMIKKNLILNKSKQKGIINMKKTSKYISAFIASALVALSLCSCEKIDSMRARQILKNTSGDELFYNGNTYNFMLYDSDDSYRLISSVYEMGMYRDETMQITDADVPVLLIDEFGQECNYISKQ